MGSRSVRMSAGRHRSGFGGQQRRQSSFEIESSTIQLESGSWRQLIHYASLTVVITFRSDAIRAAQAEPSFPPPVDAGTTLVEVVPFKSTIVRVMAR